MSHINLHVFVSPSIIKKANTKQAYKSVKSYNYDMSLLYFFYFIFSAKTQTLANCMCHLYAKNKIM